MGLVQAVAKVGQPQNGLDIDGVAPLIHKAHPLLHGGVLRILHALGFLQLLRGDADLFHLFRDLILKDLHIGLDGSQIAVQAGDESVEVCLFLLQFRFHLLQVADIGLQRVALLPALGDLRLPLLDAVFRGLVGVDGQRPLRKADEQRHAQQRTQERTHTIMRFCLFYSCHK